MRIITRPRNTGKHVLQCGNPHAKGLFTGGRFFAALTGVENADLRNEDSVACHSGTPTTGFASLVPRAGERATPIRHHCNQRREVDLSRVQKKSAGKLVKNAAD